MKTLSKRAALTIATQAKKGERMIEAKLTIRFLTEKSFEDAYAEVLKAIAPIGRDRRCVGWVDVHFVDLPEVAR